MRFAVCGGVQEDCEAGPGCISMYIQVHMQTVCAHASDCTMVWAAACSPSMRALCSVPLNETTHQPKTMKSTPVFGA